MTVEAERDHVWAPSIETGLSGDQLLNEAIEEHVDDLSDAHRPGIYVLALSTPETTDYEAYARLWLSEFDTIPDYLSRIVEEDQLLYVGAADDVYERIEEHLTSPNRSTAVAQVFPIHSLRYVHWTEDRATAFEREQAVATDLARNVSTAYVHSR